MGRAKNTEIKEYLVTTRPSRKTAVNDYYEIIIAKSCREARTKAVVKYGSKRFIKKVEIKK